MDDVMKYAELSPPTEDLDQLWNMGLAGAPLVQYLKWADDLKIFKLLAEKQKMTLDDIVAGTTLTARGADALLGVLSSLKVTTHVDGHYHLSILGEEYLVQGGDYYVGPSLYGMLATRLPRRLQKAEKVKYFANTTGTLWHRLRFFFSSREMGRPERLAVQHSRNYPAAVVAVNKGLFDGTKHLLDVGGGSGAFAMPLVRSRADVEVTLMELPRALPHIRAFLQSQLAVDRVNLLGLNMHRLPWPQVQCDGVLLGNILHFCSDDECRALLREVFRILPVRGKLFVHEMLWNENKDGPLATALWNFWMTSVSAGKQRTLQETVLLLGEAGFDRYDVANTWGSFSMLTCEKHETITAE
jgi:hypothetical protein